MKRIIVLVVLCVFMTSCSNSNAAQDNSESIALKTEIANLNDQVSTLKVRDQNYVALMSATPIIVMVTPSFTNTPEFTPTITNTPAPTLTPTATIPPTPTTDPLKADKRDGFYLVNVDIAPGVWRSTGTQENCYWETTTKTGDIIDNHFGMAGGTAYISPSAFQVSFEDCGTWVFLSNP